MSSKIPKLQAPIEQEVRLRLASARSKFQDLTHGIYPVVMNIEVEQRVGMGPHTALDTALLNDRIEAATSGLSEACDRAGEAFRNLADAARDHIEPEDPE